MTVVVTDWRWQRIPNVVTYPAMVLGVALGVLEGFPGELFRSGFLDHLAGVGLAYLVSYPLYAMGGIKAGDGKLLMAVAALRGSVFFLYSAFYGALVGGVLALGFIAARRLAPPAAGEGRARLRDILHSWIPYGVALGLGTLLALGRELTAT